MITDLNDTLPPPGADRPTDVDLVLPDVLDELRASLVPFVAEELVAPGEVHP